MMRNIDPVVKARALLTELTAARNANPFLKAVVTRPRTPIFDKRFWQESIVATSDAICTSVAVKKPYDNIEKVFAAFVKSDGTLVVRSAIYRQDIRNLLWSTEFTLPGCASCAIEFNGTFEHTKLGVEYYTEQIPYLFYTTTEGAMYGGLLGGVLEQLATTNVTAIDVVRGIRSIYGDIDQGMIVFYISEGAIYYRQFVRGVWEPRQIVGIAPANPVAIKVERLFDYRICIQVKGASGELYEIFSKMESSSWNGNEFISLALSGQNNVIEITYSDFTAAENISVALSQNNKRLYALSPVMVYAENRDNGIGDYGRVVRLVFDENIFGEQDNIGRFSLHDSSSGSWAAQSIARVNSKTLDITFLDFNNAVNPVVVAYTPGTMTGDIKNLAGDTIWFTAENLVPFDIEPPVPMSASNSDQKTIEIVFDKPISSTDWGLAKNGFTVTSYEYNRIPDGSLLPVTYVVTSVEQGATDSLIVKLTDAGRMKYPSDEVVVYYSKATGNLVGELAEQVDNFEVDFVADVEYPVFNPNDVERISASVSQTVVNRLVTYISVKEEEYVSIGLTQTNIVYHVNDIPT